MVTLFSRPGSVSREALGFLRGFVVMILLSQVQVTNNIIRVFTQGGQQLDMEVVW
jgi:hypothetical protein